MDLRQLYTQLIIEHSKSKKHRHEIEDPTYSEDGHNPSCGDELTLHIALSDDGAVIEDVAFTGTGCAVSQAAASMMCDQIKGKSVADARDLCETFISMIRREHPDEEKLKSLGDARALENVSNMPARVKCALLAWHTLNEVMKAHEEGRSLEGASFTTE